MKRVERSLLTRLIIVSLLVSFLGFVPAAFADEATTVTGYIRDPYCLITMGAKGEKHRKCAVECAQAGINLVIEEEGTGKLYLVFPEKDKINPNDKVIDYAERKVKVTGELLAQAGLTGISVQKIEAAE
jgi:hypothetical protein